MRVAYENEINSTATITVSSNEVATPKSFLYDQYLSNFLLFTGNTAEWIKIDAGSGNTIDVNTVGIAGHNFTSSAVIKIEGNATDSWGTPSFTETITYRENTIMHFTASTETYRYFRVTVADTTNTDNLEIGYLYLGEYLQMPGFSPNVNLSTTYNGTQRITRSGQIKGSKRFSYRTATVNFIDMTNTQRNDILTLMNTVFTHTTIFAVIWESSQDFEPPIYGVVTGDIISSTKSRNKEFTFPLTIREAK